jgi:hypothetical protein
MQVENIFFNANHSPAGAYAGLTLGYPGTSGGFDLELGKPACQDIFIGLQRVDRSGFDLLPFTGKLNSDDETRFTNQPGSVAPVMLSMHTVPLDKLTRDFEVATDAWHYENLSFTIYSPVHALTEPSETDKKSKA